MAAIPSMSLSFPGCHLFISSQLYLELEHLFSGTGEQASFLFLNPCVYLFYLFLVELVSHFDPSPETPFSLSRFLRFYQAS